MLSYCEEANNSCASGMYNQLSHATHLVRTIFDRNDCLHAAERYEKEAVDKGISESNEQLSRNFGQKLLC